MKLLLFAALAISTLNKADAQDSLLYNIFPVVESKVRYEKVIELPGQSKDSLFMKAKVWALGAFTSQKAAFQTEDRDGGLLAYRTFFTNGFQTPAILGVYINQDWQYWSSVRIYIKDGKTKIVLENENVKVSNLTDHRYDSEFSLFTFKQNLDGLYKHTSKKYRERYWSSALDNFKMANEKYNSIVSSLEKLLKSVTKAESDF